MTKLTNVTLSNIRRFGQDVSIDLSPGATVLLAPNGTGKTAFFEAIELGLTGAVARLNDDLTPIIGDGHEQASVRLRFDENDRFVHLDRGGVVAVQGSLAQVLGAADQADLPFLLRLTHLLDQREREWFVHADEKTAGSQLAKLPIGRDGAQANSVLVSTRRNITDRLNQASAQLGYARSELDEWERLQRERDASSEELERPLRSLSDLAAALSSVSRRSNAFQLSGPYSVQSLATGIDALRQEVSAELDRVKRRLSELWSSTGILTSSEAERERISRLQAELAKAAVSSEACRSEVKLINARLVQREEEIRRFEQQLSIVAGKLARFVTEAKERSELERRSGELKDADIALADAEKFFASSHEGLESYERLNQLHSSLRLRQQTVEAGKKELEEVRQLLARWSDLLTEEAAAENAALQARDSLQVSATAYQEAIAEHARAERVEADARNRVQAASSATDSMKQAVALVAAHLPLDQQDCPLCGVIHGAEELRKRLKASLNAIDPVLESAEQELYQATEARKREESRAAQTRAALQQARADMVRVESQQTALVNERNHIAAHPLVGAGTIEAARVKINDRVSRLEAVEQGLEAEISAAPPPASFEMVSAARELYEWSSQQLQKAQQDVAEAKALLEHATGVYSVARANIDAASSSAELSREQVEITQQLDVARVSHRAETDAFSRQQTQLRALEEQSLDLENQLGEARSRQTAAQSLWRQLGLPGDPSAELAQAVETQLTSEQASLQRDTAHIEAIELEIGLWMRAEQNRNSQSMIDRRRGDMPEDVFTANLRARIEEGTSQIETLSRMASALEKLSSLLSREIGNIHDHVTAVVPRWRDLLKRIVRDQRFAHTSLDFYSHYKKEHASVLVPLHGSSVPVPSIASEAQMTDLQLTFLLSMAMRHRWSPWRALLLDDPTQHHDLVHAASVFDVLRDYIVDHQFQVVVATHDALQARFLMRKLQNDGIPSKLWTLSPTSKGVVAIASK